MSDAIPAIAPIRWPAEAIWQAVEPSLEGFTVEILPSIDSSNSELMRRFRGTPLGSSANPHNAPRLEPTLLVAETQSAGRGRLGRSWHSRRGDSLTFSLGMALQPIDWSGLSLVVGISLAESLDPQADDSQHIGLKWPNDLWIVGPEGERKLAGILVETTTLEGARHVVIGVGINIQSLERGIELDLAVAAQTATSGAAAIPPGYLQQLLPNIDAAAALLRIVPQLVQDVQAFERFGFAPFQARFAQRDVLSSRAVRLSDGTEGTAHGVGENGALLVHTAAGMKEITSSEVSVRPC